MFNPAFTGYLRFDKDFDSNIKCIQEQKFDKKGKLISHKSINNLTLNTNQIVSVNSRTNSPMGAPVSETLYINMANGTRYAMEDIFKKDFDNKLLEAIKNPNKIIDVNV